MTPKKNKLQNQKDCQELLELAVNCRFITLEQEEELLAQLFEYSKNKTDNYAARFLFEKKVLSKEKVEMLFAIKKHLDTLMADKKFGKIGVANEFVSPEDVKKALDIQVAIFRKRKKSIKIGDILVNNNEMSVEDQTAVLLTQDRIKDESLAEALEIIGTSEMERIDINKRFGAIAVKMELISTEQLNQALLLQRKEEKENQGRRYLGDILKDLFNVADSDISKILKMQKKFEVRRMNLEESLMQFAAQKETNQALDDVFEYHVSPDKLTAWVRRIEKEEVPTNAQDLLEWLSLSGITFGLCPLEEIDIFLKKNVAEEQLMVAQGSFPSPSDTPTIEFYFNTEKNPEIMPVVKEGDTLAESGSSQNGDDRSEGVDVFGRPISLPAEGVSLTCGAGVSQRGSEFIALMDGYPKLYKKRTLFVLPIEPEYTTREIEGDILTDIEEPFAILKVDGNIAPGVNVSCHRLDIKGDILGNVSTNDDLDVYGNIGQPRTGEEQIKEPVKINSKGTIYANQNITDAIIVGEKGINAPKSDLISSRATSFCDIVVNNIISTQADPSILWVGREHVLQSDKIDQEIQKITGEMNKILHKEELDELSEEMIEKVQVQNGYLEKQNVTTYLNRVLNNPQWEMMENIAQKIEACEAQKSNHLEEADISIPENTKAHKFLKLICEKIEDLSLDDQKQYVRQLHDSITGMYKAAVRDAERSNKRDKARSTAIEVQMEELRPQIEEKEKEIEALMAQKDFFHFKRDEEETCPNPMVKVKNKVGRYTIAMGENAKKVIDKDIYSVALKEMDRESQADAKIDIEGYFD